MRGVGMKRGLRSRVGTARRARRLPYWLKRRRVAGEPAGMPACSSLA